MVFEVDNWEKKVVKECELRGYSKKTRKVYIFYIEKYLKSGKELEDFLWDLIKKGKARQTVRIAGFAVKFYHRINKEVNKTDIPNIKSGKKLPTIISKKEIMAMINSTNNRQHQLIIMTLYACGLRLSELINLKWQDIDFKRAVIQVRQGKGRKDRLIMLPKKLRKQLRVLPEKQGFVFISARKRKYSPKTIQEMVAKASKRARIKKKITPHTLRHCFATHLLEKGTDIRLIQRLLGHSRVETTTIYTQVSNNDLTKIKSPLDEA